MTASALGGAAGARAAAVGKKRRLIFRGTLQVVVVLLAAALWCQPLQAAAPRSPDIRPNIVFILADDLGYGTLGCYGQKIIQTPNLDRMAAEGMRFTQAYSGSCLCAPSRSALMTGLHTGHTPIRANGGGMALLPADLTVAKVLKQAGYATGCFGKWGLGVEQSTGHPNRQGFDQFFGYLHQVHAHFYYPYYLWDNETKSYLPENEGRKRTRYSHDEIHARALEFIRRNRGGPLFCYVAYTLPHVELVVPEDSMRPYRGKFKEQPLPDPRPGYLGADEPYAAYAGMISRLDRSVGEILALLKQLEIDERTIVFFSSDNGAQGGPWQPLCDFFHGNDPLRGEKGQFYEGGMRVPMIVRWPGHVRSGAVSDHVCAFWDVLPTLAELAGAGAPNSIDGISLVPTLEGQQSAGRAQAKHEFLYWEYPYRPGLMQAVRMGDWKALQPKPGAKFELYNLATDPAETSDVSQQNPEIMAKIRSILSGARTEARVYPPETKPGPTVADYVR